MLLDDAGDGMNTAEEPVDFAMFGRFLNDADQRGVDDAGGAAGLADNCVGHYTPFHDNSINVHLSAEFPIGR